MSTMRVYTLDELGPDGYPLAWHESIKHAVREQAGYRCVRCGHPYRNGTHGRGEWSSCDEHCTHRGPYRYEWNDIWEDVEAGEHGVNTAGQVKRRIGLRAVEARWRILTVHHLDGDKANCRWWNLVALCQRDHLVVQGKVVMERPYILEHSAWFKPYAAGFYAAKYLGEDLTREEAEANLDELLALEHPAKGPR